MMLIMAEMKEPPDPPAPVSLEEALYLAITPPRDPGWILQQLGLPSEPAQPAEPPPPRLSREEIDEMMQELLYGELKRFGLLDADGNISLQIAE